MPSIGSGRRAAIEAERTRVAPDIGAVLRSTGARTRSTFDAVIEPTQPVELLLSLRRDGTGTLGAQIEEQPRRAIRDGALRTGTEIPSTRDLARQLGVSRRI